MVIKKNIKANFWIRILATIIDLLFFILFAIGTSFIVFNYKKANFYTENILYRELIYRFWLLLLIIFIIFSYLLIPIFSKGQTIGMLICKIKIQSNEETNKKIKISKYIFDRQRLFAFFWIFIFLSFMLISTDGFLKAARGQKLNSAEKIVLSLPVILATIAVNLEALVILSGIGPSRINWNDKLSKTETVWKNKYEEVEIEENKQIILPKKRELPKIHLLDKNS